MAIGRRRTSYTRSTQSTMQKVSRHYKVNKLYANQVRRASVDLEGQILRGRVGWTTTPDKNRKGV